MKKEIHPKKDEVNHILGLFDKKDLSNLSLALKDLIKNYPSSSTSWVFLGMFYNLINNIKEAKISLQKALELDDKYAEANRLLADVSRKEGDINQAITYAKKAIKLNPTLDRNFDTLGTCYASNNDYVNAQRNFQSAIKHANSYNLPIFYNNLGNAQRNMGNYSESIRSLKKAINLNSNIIQIHINLSLSYLEKKDYNTSLEILNKLPQHQIDQTNKSSVYSAYGYLYRKLYKLALSEKYYLEALKSEGQIKASIYNSLGELFSIKRDFTKSLSFFKKAIKNSSNNNYYSNYIMTYSYLFEKDKNLIFKEIIKYSNKIEAIPEKEFNNQIQAPNKKLRIGFISGDFCEHPVSYFLLDFLEKFNDQNFESYAYYNYNKVDKVTDKLKSLFSKFNDIHHLSNAKKINFIKTDNIDILIDLSGHTSRNCLSVMKSKPSPLQMTWLGFSETTGLKEIDYIICDKISLPKSEEKWFVEKPLRLNNCYYCFSNPGTDKFKIEEKNNKTLVFGSFCNVRKVNNDVLSLWSKILKKLPESKLLLKSEFYRDKDVKNSIHKYFIEKNINKERIKFENDTLREDYLLSYNHIDLILDTFPYPGGTTTCEALFMGTPVVTMQGNSFLSRNTENILRNSGFSSFIANNEKEYINLVTSFNENLKKNIIKKEKVREKFLKSSLMNPKNFSEDFKIKIRSAWVNFCNE